MHVVAALTLLEMLGSFTVLIYFHKNIDSIMGNIHSFLLTCSLIDLTLHHMSLRLILIRLSGRVSWRVFYMNMSYQFVKWKAAMHREHTTKLILRLLARDDESNQEVFDSNS